MGGNMINNRIQALRGQMEAEGIDIYLVPTADFHESEYVGEYFKARRFITGFTGSAGTAVITKAESGLWTDGRYFIQAANQLKGSEVQLYKMGVEGVPTVEEFVEEKLSEGGCLGFDGRVVNTAEGRRLEAMVKAKGGRLKVDTDLIDRIWQERPPLSKEPLCISPPPSVPTPERRWTPKLPCCALWRPSTGRPPACAG